MVRSWDGRPRFSELKHVSFELMVENMSSLESLLSFFFSIFKIFSFILPWSYLTNLPASKLHRVVSTHPFDTFVGYLNCNEMVDLGRLKCLLLNGVVSIF